MSSQWSQLNFLHKQAAYYRHRQEKAESIGITPNHRLYGNYLEIKMRTEQLNQAALYAEAMAGQLHSKNAIIDTTQYIISIFEVKADKDETSQALVNINENLMRPLSSFDEFCKYIDVFSNYKIIDKTHFYQDLLNFIVAGIRWWLDLRELYHRVNKAL